MTHDAPLPDSPQTLVVGAGLAGLSCASLLVRRGVDVHVVDASDAVGGRIRTDEVGGFKLDRGFQVLLTAYPGPSASDDPRASRFADLRPRRARLGTRIGCRHPLPCPSSRDRETTRT